MIEVPQTAIELAKRFEGFERKVKRGTAITATMSVSRMADHASGSRKPST